MLLCLLFCYIESVPLSAADSFTNDAVSMLSTIQKPTLDSLPIYQVSLGTSLGEAVTGVTIVFYHL